MREGWYSGEYLILYDPDEAHAAAVAYGIGAALPGYRLVGLRGWDDFLITDEQGAVYTVPTVPLTAEYLEPYELPPAEAELESDTRLVGKIKWYKTPIAFGGAADDLENLHWAAHAEHRQLVAWWNKVYRDVKGATTPT